METSEHGDAATTGRAGEPEGAYWLRLLGFNDVIGHKIPDREINFENFLDNPSCRMLALPLLQRIEHLPSDHPEFLAMRQDIFLTQIEPYLGRLGLSIEEPNSATV